MNQLKTALAVAGITAVTFGGIGVASAATDSSTNREPSLVSKIASKFNLDKSEVQAVFDEAHTERHARMQEKRAEALKDAVREGELTQAQADHITAVWAEIEALMGGTAPHDQSDEARQAIKEKMDELKSWAEEEGLEMHEIMGGPRGHHGPGHARGPWAERGAEDKE